MESGVWERTTLWSLFEHNAALRGSAPAMSDSHGTLTWDEALELAGELAGALSGRFRRDDVLAVQLPNSVAQFLFRASCERAGVICAPVLTSFGRTDLAAALAAIGAAGVVVAAEVRQVAGIDEGPVTIVVDRARSESIPAQVSDGQEPGDPRPFESHEVSFLLGTSGTTGAPVFVEHSACHRIAQWQVNARLLGLGPADVFGVLSPHPGGVSLPGFFGAPILGAHTVFLESFNESAAFALMRRHGVTVGAVVPAQLARLAQHAGSQGAALPAAVKFWWCAGAPLAPESAREAERVLGGLVLNVYGATDWGGETWTAPADPEAVRFGTVGRGRDGTQVRVVDRQGRPVASGVVGEIEGAGPNCVSGYWQNPEATRERWTDDGWFRTRDVGVLDREGNLSVVGRSVDVINRGGQNIHPAEVEGYLRGHPDVAEVAVAGGADPILGERVCAFVVPSARGKPTIESLVRFLEHLGIARFKHPEKLVLCDRLPMTADGQKVDRRALRRADKS